MIVGLTLGKFAPLHAGHQRLLEHAMSHVDHLICVVYAAPDTTTVPTTVRAGWIRHLYPSIEVIEAWDGPTEVGDTSDIKKAHEQYIAHLLRGRRVDKFFCSEFYGEHMSKALNAQDCRMTRAEDSISGTKIRRDVYNMRKHIDPFVYKDLIIQAVFVGAPSTGKTTLAERLAKEHNTTWMPEYGREYWHKHQENRRLSMQQLEEIARGHRAREDASLLDANRYLFVDTNAVTTYMFAMSYYHTASTELTARARDCLQRYDLWFLCEDDIPSDDTWDRSGEMSRARFQAAIADDLRARKIPYLSLRGSLEHRVSVVNRVLATFKKFDSVTNIMREIGTGN